MDEQILKCEQILQLTFVNKTLLETALTHKSYSKQRHNRQILHNERLEFLGDAVLKLIVSEYLFMRFPEADEGILTKIRAKLISDHFLGELGLSLSLGEFMRFSYGEEQSGGRTRPSNIANAFEAILAACYLDQGFEAAKTLYIRLILPFGDSFLERNIDYKSELQEWLQRHKRPLPDYSVCDEVGPDHNKEFIARVKVSLSNGDLFFDGAGASKKAAEQVAAERAILALNALDTPSDTPQNSL